MRKFLKILCLIVAIILPVVVVPVFANTTAKAINMPEAIAARAKSYLSEFACHGIYPKQTVARIAGTYGEVYAGYYIKGKLELLASNVEAVNNSTTTDGKQNFVYDSAITKKRESSSNIIYQIKGSSSAQKIVLTCNYDNYFEPYLKQDDFIISSGEPYSEGVNASAASVAFMLAVAENIAKNTFDYDIELVFFGAGYDGNAGANYYLQTMGKQERERTLLLVDISRIAFGKDVYYYSGEFGSIHENLYAKCGLTKFVPGIAGASVDAYNSLGYENAGYSGATVLFAETGLNFLHLFAGSYDEGAFGGICEYYGKQNVLNTDKDNMDYVSDAELDANFKKLASGVVDLLSQPNITQELEKTDSMSMFNFFTNAGIVSWITLIVLLVLLLISVLIHYGITKRTYDYAKNNDIGAIMITMDDDKEDEE